MYRVTKNIVITLALFLSAFPLFARNITVTIKDFELDIPLEGAVLRSWDGKEHVSGEDGSVVIEVPDNRQVVIQAAYPGYETGRLLVTVTGNYFTMGLRLSGVMQSRELVIEAARPGSSETRTGRSVAVSGRDIAQTAEIGIVEDVMNSVKLLPGVGYAGFFNAQPSIRGGNPGDMNASLDGFYVFNPYHWGGGYSIFDPRMVQSAQLSHGVFSSRYGHTISGLLDITSKSPSPTETEFELGINTSAANFNLSLPLAEKGGILLMGRVTYYDPVVALAKQVAKSVKELEVINSIRVAPYIRSAAVTGNYRFLDNLELKATGFWGMDGIGVSFENLSQAGSLNSNSIMDFDWTNYQGFFTSALSWNPRNDMLLKLAAGTGFEKSNVDADIRDTIYKKKFEGTAMNSWYYDQIKNIKGFAPQYDFSTALTADESTSMFNVQGRADYDMELGNGLLIAAGAQEMFTHYYDNGEQSILSEKRLYRFEDKERVTILASMGIDDDNSTEELRNFLKNYLIICFPVTYPPDADNRMAVSSGYGLVEYNPPNNSFGAELGLRVDHFYLLGKGFTRSSKPALSPRLNMDFNLLKNTGFMESLDISAGTGLFASMDKNIFIAEEKYDIKEIKPNRSWTSVLGSRVEFSQGLSINIEGYYKYIYDRMYAPVRFVSDDNPEVRAYFNGKGKVWGVDLLLQKLYSRYWDGWLSYSYSWSKYRDPNGENADMGMSGGARGDDWYFPLYHRFHNLNLVFNVRPIPRINIYTRFGLASGVQISRRSPSGPISYPVYVYDAINPDSNKFIEKYYWPVTLDENNRTTPSFPMDIKISFIGNNNNGKARYEIYAAVENVLALLYNSQGNTSFNQYTGQVDMGSNSASYEIPIPIPSFGFKISY